MDRLFASCQEKCPSEGAMGLAGKLPEGWEKRLPTYATSDPAISSRKLSEMVLTKLYGALPELIGSSADPTASILARAKEASDF